MTGHGRGVVHQLSYVTLGRAWASCQIEIMKRRMSRAFVRRRALLTSVSLWLHCRCVRQPTMYCFQLSVYVAVTMFVTLFTAMQHYSLLFTIGQPRNSSFWYQLSRPRSQGNHLARPSNETGVGKNGENGNFRPKIVMIGNDKRQACTFSMKSHTSFRFVPILITLNDG